jgi:peptidoglycan/xylan/chitin deacetylase (PgdA/CDA1 family)
LIQQSKYRASAARGGTVRQQKFTPFGIRERIAQMMGEGFVMPRLDRMATLYFSFPLKRLIGRTGADRVPILMYHSVSDNLFGKKHPYYQINTSPHIFARQMKWLHEAGYHTLNLGKLRDAFENGGVPPKTVVITFDDGYEDFYTDAFPSLRRYGYTATVFLATGRIQDTPARIEGADYLTWHEVGELHREGVEFGSHTVSHPDLRSLGPEEIDYELCFSRDTIEDHLGAPVRSFAYPFAFPEEDRSFVRFLEDQLKSYGFESGVSTVLGRAESSDSRFFLPRLPVNSWDDYPLFRAKLEGGYDWLHWPQWLHKYVHHNVSLMHRPNPELDMQSEQMAIGRAKGKGRTHRD